MVKVVNEPLENLFKSYLKISAIPEVMGDRQGYR